MTTRPLSLVLCCALAVASVDARTQDKDDKKAGRLENCGQVVQEILNVPDNVPQEVLDKAYCVVVIPSMTKVAIGFGGSYGQGAMVCRTGPDFRGPWGAPAMYSLEGGSFGLQLGAQATDVVLMLMNPRAMNALLDTKVKLGADASAAAGPKGRHLEAATDASMRAEILSYSRSRGLFAGISLEGTSLRPDSDANKEVYGHDITARQIIESHEMTAPPAAHLLVSTLEKFTPTRKGDQAAK